MGLGDPDINGDDAEPGRQDEGVSNAILSVVLDVRNRRRMGEIIADDVVIAQHPDLMPALAEQLQALRYTEQARCAAEDSTQDSTDMPILQADELQAPISLAETSASIQPRIEGFRILNEVYRGGQAAVFRAVQASTSQQVAIKVMWGGALASASARSRFDREVSILAQLDNPCVVRIIDRGRTADGYHYFVMGYVNGPTLSQWADDWTKSGDLKRALTLFVKIARAVDEVNELGIIHRDLKPSNIRVTRRDNPRILDFGLATFSARETPCTDQSVTRDGDFVGTLPWASPEQVGASVKQLDRRSDVYALGVILYQLLTGRFPYDVHGSMSQAIGHILCAIPDPPSKVQRPLPLRQDAAIDRRLDQVVLKALAKSRDERYATAGAFASAVESFIERLDRGSRGRRGMIAKAVVIGACCTIAASLVWLQPWGGDRTAGDGTTEKPPDTTANVAPPTLPPGELHSDAGADAYYLSEAFGGSGGKAFVEALPPPWRLAGLRYTEFKSGGYRVINSVQGIYVNRTTGDVASGTVFGAEMGSPTELFRGPGFVIDAIEISGGAHVDGFRARFRPATSTPAGGGATVAWSDWCGGVAGKGKTELRDPQRAIVGIHGRRGDNLDKLGIVYGARQTPVDEVAYWHDAR